MQPTRFRAIASLAALALIATGCNSVAPSPNPTFIPSAPASATNQPTVPNVSLPALISGVSNAVVEGEAIAAPLNPYAPLTTPLVGSVLGGLSILLAGLAKRKSDQANASADAAAVMATGIVQAGQPAVQAVLNVASSTPHFATVANHINDATP